MIQIDTAFAFGITVSLVFLSASMQCHIIRRFNNYTNLELTNQGIDLSSFNSITLNLTSTSDFSDVFHSVSQ